MGGQLHELLAVIPSLKGAAQKIAAETEKTFRGKGEHFVEVLKTYQPLDEDGEMLPSELAPMVTTVGEKLQHFHRIYGPLIDGVLQVDESNLKALATVEIDGLKIAGLPSTFLMQLDKRLSDMRAVYDAMPTLNPGYVWAPDDPKGKGISKANDEKRNRAVKSKRPIVMYEATKEHPAQIEVITEEKKVGEYTTQRWSGKLSPFQKYQVLHRLDKLQRAVKRALSAANAVDHSKRKVADVLFAYIHGDIPMERGEHK